MTARSLPRTELALACKLSNSAVKRLMHAGLRYRREGRQIVIAVDDFLEFLKSTPLPPKVARTPRALRRSLRIAGLI